MVRKPKKKSEGETYYKAKNGRWYKKVQIDGRTRCRFVSKAEVEGAMTKSKPATKKPASHRKQETPPGSSSDTPPAHQAPSKPKRRRRKKEKTVDDNRVESPDN